MRDIYCAHASGAEWRAALENTLGALGEAGRRAALGFCYLTDAVGAEADAVLRCLRQGSKVAHWVGTVGAGVCGDGVEYFDTPAAAIMTLYLPESSFKLFSAVRADLSDMEADVGGWIDDASPRFAVVHGDPRNPQVESMIAALSSRLGSGFLVGGLSSARHAHFQLADAVVEGGISGVLFGSDVAVTTRLSQGCTPIGPRHVLTRAQDNVAFALDGRSALEVFAEDLADLEDVDPRTLAGLIHVAIPVAGSDTGDYMVRNLMGIDPERGAIAVGELLADVEQLMFCRRDAISAANDLSRMLREIKKGLQSEPRGAVYFSCIARGARLFGPASRELKIIQQNIGSLPLAGFFGNGEISNNRLYGYTGVLTLFL